MNEKRSGTFLRNLLFTRCGQKRSRELVVLKNVLKRIFRMRQNYWPALIKFTVETTRSKDSARYLIIETTFWNYSYCYKHLYGSECNLKKTSTSKFRCCMSLKYECNLKTLKNSWVYGCFSKLYEKPYYNLLIIDMKKFYRSWIFMACTKHMRSK